MPQIIQLVENLISLEHLDVSATHLTGGDISQLITALSNCYPLKSLNISFNSIKIQGSIQNKNKPSKVIQQIASYIHFQDNLLHFDIGGMNLNFTDMKYLFEQGLAKSRTLRSCHLIGVTNFGEEKFKELCDIIKIRDPSKDDFSAKLN